MRDDQGFILLEEPDQVGEFAQLLLDNTLEKREERRRARLRKREQEKPRDPAEDAKAFDRFTLPVIRDAVDSPVLSDLLSVQPMTGPTDPTVTPLVLEFKHEEPWSPTCGPQEELHQYHYGPILAERGGWFVTPKGDYTRVLRYRQDWLS